MMLCTSTIEAAWNAYVPLYQPFILANTKFMQNSKYFFVSWRATCLSHKDKPSDFLKDFKRNLQCELMYHTLTLDPDGLSQAILFEGR